MSHSPPAAGPVHPPNFVDGSPAQLANILSSVLQQNADLSNEVVALKKLNDERSALHDQLFTTLRHGASSSSAEPLPETALKAIVDLEARLQEEKNAHAETESRLRAMTDAWTELERYLHQTELLSASARASFSQALRDSPNAIVGRLTLNKPPPVPPFQRRDPPRPLQAMATMPLPPPPSRIRHRADSTEDHSPPAKRLRADRSRYPAELPARPPPYYPELTLHPSAYPPPPPPPHAHPHPRHAHHHRSHSHASQHPQPHHGHSHSRGRSPSLSLSPARSRTRSRSSSLSIDDLLLQVATDERPTSPQGTHLHPNAAADPSLVQYHPPRPRGRSSSPRTARAPPPPQPLQLQGSVQQYQTHVFAPPVTGPPSKKKALEKTNTLVEPLNGSSTPQRFANAAAAAGLPPGGFPPTNDKGQRICRQCGLPGRYKDGKCVEKWGPGPEGPGTVCDRCRKKMKRVERRGTMDTLAQAQAQAFASQQHLEESPPTHAAGARTPVSRGPTVTVSHPPIATLAEPDSETSPQASRVPHSHALLAHPPPRPAAGSSSSSRSPGSRTSQRAPHSDEDADVDMSPPTPATYVKPARISPPRPALARRSSGEDDDAEGEAEDAEADGEADDDVDVDDDLLDAVNASEANGHGQHAANANGAAVNGAGAPWVKREMDAMEV